jgi:Flp pilus assembly pilin Flp
VNRQSRSRRWRAEHGTSAVEYALIIAGCGAALIGGVVILNGSLRSTYEASARGVETNVVTDPPDDLSSSTAPEPEVSLTPSPTDVPEVVDSPTPTPTSASPTTSSASPTPTTRPRGSIKVDVGDEADSVDIGANGGSKGFSATVDPEWAGSAYLDRDDELVFEASKKVAKGIVVTVSWSYAQGGKVYSGTTTYWVSD